ncbi:MAG: flagellar biosynthetic protein FliO [Phycisphaerae bacterium]|nr:flagellar biosynthetic protein FliO [Phycisphaerae bacterium]
MKPVGKTIWILLIVGCLVPLGRCADDANALDPSTTVQPRGPATPWKGFGNPNDKLPEQTDLFRQFATAIGFVLVLGVGAFYVSRRLGPRWHPSRGRHLRVVETIALGPQRHIHLLEVEGRRLVVGSTSQAIRLIAELGEPSEPKGNGTA